MSSRDIFNFKSFIKFLGKNKLYTFIEIFGLSVSLMFVILIGVYTTQELSTDNFQKNKDRLYLLASEESFGHAYRLGEKMKDMYPEIEEVCPFVAFLKKLPVVVPEGKANADLLFVDPSFFSMMSFPIIKGDASNPLVTPNYAVISESFARKTFPGKDPLGQVIKINESVVVTINGVMQDIQNSAIPYGDILLRCDHLPYWASNLLSEGYEDWGSVGIIVLTKEGANLNTKTDDLLTYLKENAFTYEREVLTQISFVPLKEVYFSKINGYNGFLVEQGDKLFVLILLSVGSLILLFAIINYINLSVAQTGFRAKEMATRRLLGSSRKDLFYRLMTESTLLTLISFFIGLLLSRLISPQVENLLETQINLRIIFTPVSSLITFAILFMIGILSGLLPALVISNAKPIEVVKGTFRQKTKMVYSKFFITLQHGITIAMIAAAIVMVFQLKYLTNAPLGYNTANIIDVDVSELHDKQMTLMLANEFNQLASVKRTAFSEGLPYKRGQNYSMSIDGHNFNYQGFVGDSTFVDMLGVEILKDNQLASDDGFYLSELAFKEIGINEDETIFPIHHFGGTHRPIAGVIKDFRLENILFEARPILLQIKKIEDFEPRSIAIEITGNPYTALNQIKEIYERLTQFEFTGKYISQQIEESFTQQKRASTIVVIFSGIATLLSILGLIAMSTYFIQQRSREIAVRKVFGSTNKEVLKRLVFNFLNYVMISFIIVTPLIWYIMKQWLAGYSYRIHLSPLFFICAGLFCLLISFLTVFWQSYHAANTNPVENIKTE